MDVGSGTKNEKSKRAKVKKVVKGLSQKLGKLKSQKPKSKETTSQSHAEPAEVVIQVPKHPQQPIPNYIPVAVSAPSAPAPPPPPPAPRPLFSPDDYVTTAMVNEAWSNRSPRNLTESEPASGTGKPNHQKDSGSAGFAKSNGGNAQASGGANVLGMTPEEVRASLMFLIGRADLTSEERSKVWHPKCCAEGCSACVSKASEAGKKENKETWEAEPGFSGMM